MWFAVLAGLFVAMPCRADFGLLDGDLEIESLATTASSPRFVTLAGGASPKLRLHDSESTAPLLEVPLNPAFRYLDIEPADDGIGGILLLGVRVSGGGVRVWRWDVRSTRLSRSLSFGSSFRPMDLETYFDEGSGEVRVAVLAYFESVERTRVVVKAFETPQSRTLVDFGRAFAGQDLELHAVGDAPPSMSVLGSSAATGASIVKVAAADSDASNASISFGRVGALDHLVMGSSSITDLLHVVLRRRTGTRFVRIDVRDTGGERIGLLAARTDSEPIKLLPLAFAEESLIGLLTDHPDHHGSTVHILDALGEVPHETVDFGVGSPSEDAVTLGNGEPGTSTMLAVTQTHALAPGNRVKIRTIDDVRRITIPIGLRGGVPDWFESNRVHGHTRLSLVHPRFGLDRSFYDTELSANAADHMKDLGAGVFTRHAKSADEDPWWPSAVPSDSAEPSRYRIARENEGISLEAAENPIRSYVEESWSRGLPVMLYYADSGESEIAADHPEWVCRDSGGSPVAHSTKGFFLDLTSDYGDVVETRLLELADMGASGIYLDFRHMPANGCWGTNLEDEFRSVTGFPAPPVANTAEYMDFARYAADRTADVIAGWEEALAREYPELQLVVSVTSVPALTRADMSSRLAAIASPKSEFRLAVARGQSNNVFHNDPDLHAPADHVRMAFGWSLLRDIAGADLPHIWTASTPGREHLLSFVSAVTAYGSVAAIDVLEELLAPGGVVDGLATRDDLRAGFELGARISQVMSGTKPVRSVGVHYSESARDRFLRDSRQAWEQVLLPTVAGFDAMRRLGLPIKVVTDDMIVAGGLDDLEVFYAAAPMLSGAAQRTELTRFEGSGGVLLTDDTDTDWTTASGYEAGVAALSAVFATHASDSPVSAENLPEAAHVVPYLSDESEASPRVVIAVVNRFDFVQSFTLGDLPLQESINTPPPSVPAGVRVRVATSLLNEAVPSDVGPSVRDVLDGTLIESYFDGDALVLTLPEIRRMLLLVIEP